MKGVTAEMWKDLKLRKGICEKKDKSNRLTQYNIALWSQHGFPRKEAAISISLVGCEKSYYYRASE